jgi:hypothetical protein
VWRDLAVRRRKTEIDSQIAEIVAVARSLGHDAPLTQRLVELIHDIEDGRRAIRGAEPPRVRPAPCPARLDPRDGQHGHRLGPGPGELQGCTVALTGAGGA